MEEWRDVKGYEGLYMVSSTGIIKSVERTVWNSRGFYKTVSERILKARKNKYGYLHVVLHKDNKAKEYYIHRLVAEAFLPNPDGLSEVNHKDEDKINNCVSNLEWCSHKQNVNYGTRTKRMTESMINNPKRSKPVIAIDKVSGTTLEFPSINEASRVTGVSLAGIIYCCKGRYKYAGGYFWQYID